MREPGFQAQRLEKIIDPALLETHGEIERAVAGTLLVANGFAEELVAIAE